jgi:NAD(P)-dependent dehydrogenase (short-subunit alcohol dehydrogenase family)
MDAATWRATFDTNVIGAATVAAAAIPHLERSGGTAAFLTSNSSLLTAPWPGLGAYIVSKAALNKLVEALRGEHPGVGFTQVVVGECAGGQGDSQSQFSAGWDMDLAIEMGPIWMEQKYMSGALLEVDELVSVIDTVLRCGSSATIPTVAVTPRPPA